MNFSCYNKSKTIVIKSKVMKCFISVDIEGSAGTLNWNYPNKGNTEYEKERELLTNEGVIGTAGSIKLLFFFLEDETEFLFNFRNCRLVWYVLFRETRFISNYFNNLLNES